jgi:glycine/D-amino acid oxidase-like deaminating enzyme
MTSHDAIVIGGGLVGSAVACGLVDQGLGVVVLDEGDVAYRASRGNFGLVWVQSKGLGMPAYADWTRSSADLWPGFAEMLSQQSGLDIGYRKPGGLMLCLSEDELEERRVVVKRMHNQPGVGSNDIRLLDRTEVREMLPLVGDAVIGATYSPHDGHANPLYLLRALHKRLADRGASYRPNSRVGTISRDGSGYVVETAREKLSGGKIVLAAGLGNKSLARQVSLDVPVNPLKGQILITERSRPLLGMPTVLVRQTEEGGFMLGDSHEDVGFRTESTVDVISHIAGRAVRSFPFLRNLRVVRAWAALRIMTPDGFPVYEQSETHPGVFNVSCHSGVTLAAQHALRLAPLIAAGDLTEALAPFSAKRFHVSQE